MAKEKKEFTMSFEEAWKIYSSPVQCGECYCFYDPHKNDKCPLCNSTEWLGSI